MKTLKYTIPTMDEYIAIVERFNLRERISVSDAISRIKSNDLSILFSFSEESVFSISTYYSKNEFPEVTSSQKDLFFNFYEDKTIFSEFKYKMPFDESLVDFAREYSFLENNVDPQKKFFFIGIFPAYKDSTRKIYNILDDEYLFSRADDFIKTDVNYFKDVLFVRRFFNLGI